MIRRPVILSAPPPVSVQAVMDTAASTPTMAASSFGVRIVDPHLFIELAKL